MPLTCQRHSSERAAASREMLQHTGWSCMLSHAKRQDEVMRCMCVWVGGRNLFRPRPGHAAQALGSVPTAPWPCRPGPGPGHGPTCKMRWHLLHRQKGMVACKLIASMRLLLAAPKAECWS
eukprot:362629-Chlamydomonas_euryale.AAC.3